VYLPSEKKGTLQKKGSPEGGWGGGGGGFQKEEQLYNIDKNLGPLLYEKMKRKRRKHCELQGIV